MVHGNLVKIKIINLLYKIICWYWSFTKLGHINLIKAELRELLAKEYTVTITIGLK